MRRQGPTQVVFRKVADMPDAGSVAIAMAFRGDHESAVLNRFREAAPALPT